MGKGDLPVTDDAARDSSDVREVESALSTEAWAGMEDTLQGGSNAARTADLELGALEFDTNIYGGANSPASDSRGTAPTSKEGPDGGVQANSGPSQELDIEIGPAVIEPQPRIELEIGPAVIEPQPRIELEIGEPVIETPEIEIEFGEPVIERVSRQQASDKNEPREIAFNPDGSSSYEIVRGDTLREISRDVLRARHADDPNYSPTGRELDRTVQELARHNHIEDPDLIRTGRMLEIPSHVPANVRVNEGGRVTDIAYPNGTNTQVEYGPDHQPSEIRSNDGTWRRETGGWNHYDSGNNRTQHLDGGGIQVRSDGAIEILDGRGEGQVRFPSGSFMDSHENGSGVWRNAAGRPEQIDYPNGRPSSSIHHDAAGNPDRLQVGGPGGQEWRREADGWHQYDNGTRRDGPPEQVEITNDGTINLRTSDGDRVTWHPDGETTTTMDGVTTERGRTTDIQRPNGRNDHLLYDAQGNLTEVRSSDNSYWRLDANGWNQYDSNNAVVRHLDGGSITVNEQDGIEILDRYGAGEVRWPNGGITEQNGDGSGIWRNAAGHPEQIDYPNGRPSSSIHLDAAGNPDRVQVGGPGGQEWRRDADGWHQYDRGTRREGPPDQIQISNDGTISLRTSDGDSITWHPNGDATTEFAQTSAQ